MTPEQIMQAHQYLYYVKGRPVWTDSEYDYYCKRHGLFGGGGSDRASDYTKDVIAYAESLHETRSDHAPQE